MNAPLTASQYAEHHGSAIGKEVLHDLFNATDQAEACRALMDGLISAFNPSGDPLVDAVIGGFSVRIVNVLERGVAAIKADPAEDEPC